MVLKHTSNLQFNKQIEMPLHMSKNIFYTNKNAQFSYGLIRAIPVETASNGKDCVCKKVFQMSCAINIVNAVQVNTGNALHEAAKHELKY